MTGLAFSEPKANGRPLLVSADRGGYIVEWPEGKTGVSTTEIEPRFSKTINAIALSRDGTFLLTAGDDLLSWDYSPESVMAAASNLANETQQTSATP